MVVVKQTKVAKSLFRLNSGRAPVNAYSIHGRKTKSTEVKLPPCSLFFAMRSIQFMTGKYRLFIVLPYFDRCNPALWHPPPVMESAYSPWHEAPCRRE
jgi:hypothetical protein